MALNRHLPYDLEEDAASNPQAIVEGLTTAVNAADEYEIRYWIRALNRFLDLRYKLDPSTRAALARVLLAHVQSNTEDQVRSAKRISLLNRVLKKRRGVPLEIAWRPLFDLVCDTVIARTDRGYAGRAIKEVYGGGLLHLIDHARRFFPPSAVPEIAAELKPLFCPHDWPSSHKAQALLVTFMPTHHGLWEPWFADVLHRIEFYETAPEWASVWLGLLARLAKDCWRLRVPGGEDTDDEGEGEGEAGEDPDADAEGEEGTPPAAAPAGPTAPPHWEPLVPRLFARLLRDLELPVGSGRTPKTDAAGVPSETRACLSHVYRNARDQRIPRIVKILVYAMKPSGPGGRPGAVMECLERLLGTVGPYFHPSNSGGHSGNLARLLSALVDVFASRVQVERKHAASPLAAAFPQSDALGETDVAAFVAAILPAVNLALFSKSTGLSQAATTCFRQLAYLAPQAALAPLLAERIQPALGVGPVVDERLLNASHHTIGSIEALSALAHALLWRELRPRVTVPLLDLLNASLPGIDANDPSKTRATLRFYANVCYLAPLVPAPRAGGGGGLDGMALDDGGDEADEEARRASHGAGEWAEGVLGRLFEYLSHAEKPKKGKDAQEEWDAFLVQRTAELLFAQLASGGAASPYDAALERLCCLVADRELPHARKQVSLVVGAATLAHPERALPRFVRLAERALDPASHPAESEWTWHLALLAQAVRRAGPALLKHLPAVRRLLDAALASPGKKKAVKAAGKLLRRCLFALTAVYPVDQRSLPPSAWKEEGELWRQWGRRYRMKDDLCPAWHVPSAEEAAAARGLVAAYLQRPLATLREAAGAPREALYAALQTALALARGSCTFIDDWLPAGDEPDDDDRPDDDAAPARPKRLLPPLPAGQLPRAPPGSYPGLPPEGPAALLPLLSSLARTTLGRGGPRESDVAAAVLAAKLCHVLLSVRGAGDHELSQHFVGTRRRACSYFRGVQKELVYEPRAQPRALLIEQVYNQHLRRVEYNAMCVPYGAAQRRLVSDLAALSSHPFAKVRKKAQAALTTAARRYPPAVGRLAPRLIDALRERAPPRTTPSPTPPAVAAASGAAQLLPPSPAALRSASPSQAPPATPEERAVEDRVTAACCMLQSVHFMRRVTREWRLVARFVRAILATSHHEKLSLQSRLANLFFVFAVGFRPLALADGADRRVRAELYEHLLDLLDAPPPGLAPAGPAPPALHWRYQLKALTAAVLLLRPDDPEPCPPRAVATFFRLAASDLAPLRQVALHALTALLRAYRPAAPPPPPPPAEPAEPDAAPFAEDPSGDAARWNATAFLEHTFEGYAPGSAAAAARERARKAARRRVPANQAAVLAAVQAALADGPLLERVTGFMMRDHHYGDAEGGGGAPGRLASGGGIADLLGDILGAANGGRGHRPSSTQEAFVALHAGVAQGIARTAGPEAALAALWPLLESASRTTSERDNQCATAEMLAGLLRGSRRWPLERQRELWGRARPLLRACLDAAGASESVADWAGAVRFVVHNRDPRRLCWLSEELLGAVEGAAPSDTEAPAANDAASAGSAAAQANRFKFLQPLMDEFDWKARHLSARLVAAIVPRRLRHPFKQVREEIGRSMIFVAWAAWDPPAPGRAPPQRPHIAAVLEAFARGMAQCDAEDAVPGARDESPEGRDRTALRETALFSLIHAFQSACGRCLLPYFLPPGPAPPPEPPGSPTARSLFPLLLRTGRKQSRPQLVAQAEYLSALIAQSNFASGEAGAPALLAALRAVTADEAWHVRASVLPVLQLVVYTHLFLLPAAEQAAALELACGLLQDPQLEVREAAGVAVASLARMRGTAPELQREALLKRFAKLAGAAGGGPEAERQRHAGCLGLVAVLHSAPYDVPPWMPPLVARIARIGIGDASPVVRNSARKGLQEFKKSHVDGWAEDKTKFDEEQLSALNDVILQHNYFA